MAADAWDRTSAQLAAQSVFALAQENPVLRPSSPDEAERSAARLAPGGQSIPRAEVEAVIAGLPEDEVARLVRLVEHVAPGRWTTLVDEVGLELAREPLLAGIATHAIAELVPSPLWIVTTREATADLAPGPIDVLASLLLPESVWSDAEARAAHALASSLPLPHGLAAIVSFADAEITTWHLDRARLVSGCIAPLLPIRELPRTSRHLAEALELVARRRGARELCRLLLLIAVRRLDGLVPIAPSPN